MAKRGVKKAEMLGIEKEGRHNDVRLNIWTKWKPNEVIAIDKLVDVYGGSRQKIISSVVCHFLSLDDDKQRAVLLAEELHRKHAAVVAAQLKASQELKRIEEDMKRIGLSVKEQPCKS